MAGLKEKLTEPFQRLAREQDMLDNSWEQLEEHTDLVRLWPVRKKRLLEKILKPMQRWAAGLKQMARPMNMKRYKKEKKQMMRVRFPAFYSWEGFSKKFRLLVLKTLNLIRMTVIVGIVFGIIGLILYFFMKLFGIVKT